MRLQKAINNLLFSLILQVVNALSGLILPRLFISTYGSTINGLINSIKQVLSYLYLVEAGIATSSAQALYNPLAQNNKEQINRVLTSTKEFYLKSGSLFSLLICVLTCVYPFAVREYISNIYVMSMVVVLGISGIMEYLLFGKYRVLVVADQRNYIISIAQIITTILNTVLSMLLVFMKYDILIILWSSSILNILMVTVLIVFIKKKYQYINFKSGTTEKLIPQRWDAFIHQIASMIVFNSPVLILTLFTSLSNVSVYSVYNMVFVILTSMATAFSNGLIAGFGNVLAKGEGDVLNKSYSLFEFAYYFITFWLYSLASLLIIPFMNLYTAGITDANYIQPTVAILFVAVNLINNLRVPALTLIYADGRFKETKTSAIIEVVISLVVSLSLVKYLGISGVLVGALCAALYRIFSILIFANNKILRRSCWKSKKPILLNLILGLITVAIANSVLFYGRLIPRTWADWVEASFFLGIASFVILFIGNFVFNNSTTRGFMTFLKELKKRKKNIST
ncbi:lipopolysaccharide biosynthesis protein [Cohnella sp. GCM10020058]|uniref:lipopolysaccharide biosynthesis protein n=1 Tax=Cohnella sp. GCM10020058 TaxID=3317330 RepID=UPI0036374B10